MLIDDRVMSELAALVPLAPLHQPHNIAAIRAVAAVAPKVPQVACFDTAFHRNQPIARVVPTDENLMIARHTRRLLDRHRLSP